MECRTFTVKAEWDDEAACWYVADSDVPGLVTGANTLPELLAKLQEMIPELLELNAHLLAGWKDWNQVPVELITTKSHTITLHH